MNENESEYEDKKHLKNFLAIFIFITFSIYHVFIYANAKHSIPKQILEPGHKQSMSPYIAYYSNTLSISTNEHIKKCLNETKPFIIKNIPQNFFENASTIVSSDIKESFGNLDVGYNDYIVGDKLNKLIKDVTGMPIIFVTSMGGKYVGNRAHIDSYISYNFYYVNKGEKMVWIIPEEYTNTIELKNALDHLYVKADGVGTTNLDWLNKIPYYYKFNIKAGDVLVFNSSKCIHKFINVNGNEQARSIILYTTEASPLVVKHNIGNWELAKYYSYFVVNKKLERNPYQYVDNDLPSNFKYR